MVRDYERKLDSESQRLQALEEAKAVSEQDLRDMMRQGEENADEEIQELRTRCVEITRDTFSDYELTLAVPSSHYRQLNYPVLLTPTRIHILSFITTNEELPKLLPITFQLSFY